MKNYLILLFISIISIISSPLTIFADSHAREIQKYAYADYGHKSLNKLYGYLLTPNDPDDIQKMHLKVLEISIMFRLKEYENADKEMAEVRKMMNENYDLYLEFIRTYL